MVRRRMDRGSIKKDWQYCKDILPKVSRTFALNIEQLEGEVFKTVLIGYLIFRIVDTFEDNDCRSESEKIADLKDLSMIFEGDKDLSERLRLYESLKFRWRENSHEKNLIENGQMVLRCYFDLPDTYRTIIDPLVVEAIGGMIKFKKLKIESRSKIYQIKDIRELRDYCYYVAGIVGVMLTKIFCQKDSIKDIKSELERYQIHFGLALQLVNIIKDYEKDIARGWCYIPSTITEKYRINLDDIMGLSVEQRQGMVKELSRHAATYLDSTLKYIELLPLKEKSIRMFCIIPFVLAYSTLVKINKMKGNKLSRKEVAYLLDRCNAYAISNSDLESDYLRIRDGVIIW
ncbi:MAG: phytoene/squalene synthase family protein [Thermodesulfovibrionales bacterium]